MSDPNINQLRTEWDRLRLRYRIGGVPPELDKLMLKWRRKGARERFLRDRLAELQAEREVLQTEIEGIERTLRAYLNDIICQIKEDHGYGWSPSPVLGFRMWKLSPAGFHGYREHWKSPELMAECPTTGDGTDVPHTDGKCGSPPCGIYAAKRVEDLLIEHRPWDLMESAVGLVAMTGKVVEHERGYRGEYVAVLAIALPRGQGVQTTGDSEEIGLLFQGVGLSTAWHQASEPSSTDPSRQEIEESIIREMNELKRRKSQWILESPNEL